MNRATVDVSVPFSIVNQCAYCYKPLKERYRCSKCQKAYYCSQNCQERHWTLCHCHECETYSKNIELLEARFKEKHPDKEFSE